MNQPGFFDLADRYAKLDSLGDPLPKIDAVVDWSRFRPILAKIRRNDRKSQAGRATHTQPMAKVLSTIFRKRQETGKE